MGHAIHTRIDLYEILFKEWVVYKQSVCSYNEFITPFSTKSEYL